MDPANNRFTITDVESYSHWTAGTPLAPTAANVNVSGRVVDASGRGVYGARVTMQDQAGRVVYAITNPFGHYQFTSVPAGQTYIILSTHKLHQFQARTVNVTDDLVGLDFIAEPAE